MSEWHKSAMALVLLDYEWIGQRIRKEINI